jgi:hypothetical protein
LDTDLGLKSIRIHEGLFEKNCVIIHNVFSLQTLFESYRMAAKSTGYAAKLDEADLILQHCGKMPHNHRHSSSFCAWRINDFPRLWIA